MSRGPGRVQNAILTAVAEADSLTDDDQRAGVSTDDLAVTLYGTDAPSRARTESIRRAAYKLMRAGQIDTFPSFVGKWPHTRYVMRMSRPVTADEQRRLEARARWQSLRSHAFGRAAFGREPQPGDDALLDSPYPGAEALAARWPTLPDDSAELQSQVDTTDTDDTLTRTATP